MLQRLNVVIPPSQTTPHLQYMKDKGGHFEHKLWHFNSLET